MIELSAPSVLRENRPEKFSVVGFTCPNCNGIGWGWRRNDGTRFDWFDGGGFVKATCPTCGGTGEVDAEVTVNWKRQQKKDE